MFDSRVLGLFSGVGFCSVTRWRTLLFVFGVYGCMRSGLVMCQVSIDLRSSFAWYSIWKTQIPRVLTFDPFRERRDGGLSLPGTW